MSAKWAGGKLLTTIYLVRHGQSQGNVNLELGQETPPTKLGSDLTSVGKQQVKLLGQKLKPIRFDAIFSSPLLRAQRTAAMIAKDRHLAVLTKETLQERRKGNLGGKSELQLRQEIEYIFGNPRVLTEQEMWQWKLFEDMESAEEAVTRFMTALREIAVAYPGKTILMVTHGNVMRSFLVRLGYASFKQLLHGGVENTGYLKIKTDGIDFFIKETFGVHVMGS
jgi:phosphoserine phosphatase